MITDCPGCGARIELGREKTSGVRVQYCELTCERIGTGYVDVTTHTDRFVPHLHVTCTRCELSLLQAVENRDEVERRREIGAREIAAAGTK